MSRQPDFSHGDDVVWTNIPENDDVSLVPTDPDVDLARRKMRSNVEGVTTYVDLNSDDFDIVPSEPFKFQFSIKRMFVGTTCIALILGITQWFAADLLAGILGICVLLTFATSPVLNINDRRVIIAWWTMLGLYVVASIVAVVGR